MAPIVKPVAVMVETFPPPPADPPSQTIEFPPQDPTKAICSPFAHPDGVELNVIVLAFATKENHWSLFTAPIAEQPGMFAPGAKPVVFPAKPCKSQYKHDDPQVSAPGGVPAQGAWALIMVDTSNPKNIM